MNTKVTSNAPVYQGVVLAFVIAIASAFPAPAQALSLGDNRLNISVQVGTNYFLNGDAYLSEESGSVLSAGFNLVLNDNINLDLAYHEFDTRNYREIGQGNTANTFETLEATVNVFSLGYRFGSKNMHWEVGYRGYRFDRATSSLSDNYTDAFDRRFEGDGTDLDVGYMVLKFGPDFLGLQVDAESDGDYQTAFAKINLPFGIYAGAGLARDTGTSDNEWAEVGIRKTLPLPILKISAGVRAIVNAETLDNLSDSRITTDDATILGYVQVRF